MAAPVSVTYPSLDRAGVVERLKEACGRLKGKLPMSRVILFGSYARNRYTAGSDIDVLFVYSGDERHDAYKVIMSEVKLPRLEPRILNEEQFASMMAASPKFAKTLAREGIVVFGGGLNSG